MSPGSGAVADIVPERATRLARIAAPIAAAAAFYAWNFADLFPLIEYRQWIDRSDLLSTLHFFYHTAIRHTDIAFSRATSFLAVALFEAACGPAIVCHNLLHIAVLLGAAALLGATLLRQSESRNPAIVAAALIFFLFSVPVLDAAAWQATILDKYAVLLVALFTWYVARPRLPILFDQLALLALTVLAVNAKEAAWTVLASLVLLATLQQVENAPSIARALPAAFGRVLARFALALAYAIMHIGVVMAKLTSDNIADLARVTSGSAAANLQGYLAFLLGAAGLAAAVVAAGAIAAWSGPRRNRLMLSWASISFVLAIALPLRTRTQEPFYLLVPLFYLAAALFWIATGVIDAARGRARMMVAAIIAALLIARLVDFGRGASYHLAIAELSRNFQKTLAAVGTEIARGRPQSVTFHAGGHPKAYMFLEPIGLSGHALARYLASPGATERDIVALRRMIDAPAAGEGLQVRLRPDMSLESLTRSSPADPN